MAVPEAPTFAFWHRLSESLQSGDVSTLQAMLLGAIGYGCGPLFPSVLVDAVEFSTWARAEGIATLGEVERRISNTSAGVVSEKSGGSGNLQTDTDTTSLDRIWKAKAKQYANEIYRHDKACGCEPSKADLAKSIAARFAEENIGGPRGRLSAETILRHALLDWQRPS